MASSAAIVPSPGVDLTPYRRDDTPAPPFAVRTALRLRPHEPELTLAAMAGPLALLLGLYVAGSSWAAGAVLCEGVALLGLELMRRLPDDPSQWGEAGQLSADATGVRWNGKLLVPRGSIREQTVMPREDGTAVVRLRRRDALAPVDVVVASIDEASELLEALALTPWSPPPSFSVEPIGLRDGLLRYLSPLPALASLLLLRLDSPFPRLEVLAFVGLHLVSLWMFDRRSRVEIRPEGLRLRGIVGERLFSWGSITAVEHLCGGLRLELKSGERVELLRFSGPVAHQPRPRGLPLSPLAWHAREAMRAAGPPSHPRLGGPQSEGRSA